MVVFLESVSRADGIQLNEKSEFGFEYVCDCNSQGGEGFSFEAVYIFRFLWEGFVDSGHCPLSIQKFIM